MTNEMKVLRANIMGGMNEYIKELGDDDLWDIWIEVFPDECSEEELMEMAEDEDIFTNVIHHFSYALEQISNYDKII